MNRIFISGLIPGNGGVPRFLEYLKDNNFSLITPKKDNSFFEKILYRIAFLIKILFCRIDNTYVIIHHQTIPFLVLLKLLLVHKVEYFAIDNSYFCISSYNYNPNIDFQNPCRNCLKKTQPEKSCDVFPSRRKKFTEVLLLKILRRRLSESKARIYTLSESSTRLVKESIPGCGEVKTIGFTTNELTELFNYVESNQSKNNKIVFHGHCLPSKGYEYMIKLAKELPNFEFIFPTEGSNYDNVHYIPCSWDTGLKDLVEQALFVAVPSMWDNTPEAASLKAMLMKTPLLFIPSEFSFEHEASSHYGIALTGVTLIDAALINKGINDIDHLKSRDLSIKFLKESEIRLSNLK